MKSNYQFRTIKIFSLVLISTFILFNCKKELDDCRDDLVLAFKNHNLDTIKPSSYIMAYPGSWWEYDNGKIDSCFEWIPQKTYIVDNNGECIKSYENMQYLPRTSFGVVKGNYIVEESYNKEGVNIEINTQYVPWTDTLVKLGETASWNYNSINSSYGGTNYVASIEEMEKLDSLIVNGNTFYDIIHCKINIEPNAFKAPGNIPNTLYDYYFAKNIGIIMKYRSRSPFLPYYSDSTVLINHYIAPH